MYPSHVAMRPRIGDCRAAARRAACCATDELHRRHHAARITVAGRSLPSRLSSLKPSPIRLSSPSRMRGYSTRLQNRQRELEERSTELARSLGVSVCGSKRRSWRNCPFAKQQPSAFSMLLEKKSRREVGVQADDVRVFQLMGNNLEIRAASIGHNTFTRKTWSDYRCSAGSRGSVSGRALIDCKTVNID